MNIATLLKNAPRGTKLYSPIHGDVIFQKVTDAVTHPIEVLDKYNHEELFAYDGRYLGEYADGECMLFPSKDNRDWSTFKVE